MGHVLNYTLGDVVSHVRRRNGWSVLRPMGYDAFGLPAENAAIREGGHPREVTERNIAAIRAQIKRMGWSIDWTREVSTHEPEYYRWTQWLFLKLFEAGLAYRKAAPVKWCPNDQTVLANEQVIDGRCERCGAEVEARNLEQWMFKITDYADRLLDDMAQLDWPERVLTMQRNWIGRSEGAEVTFRVEELDEDVAGLHDAPGHALRRDVLRARARASAGRAASPSARPTPTDLRDVRAARRARRRARSARPTRRRPASSPASTRSTRSTTSAIPIWVADYVLMDYGTGAIMAVPAHDERDFAFAETFGLPIVQVVAPAARRGRARATAYVVALRRRGARQLRAVHRAVVARGEDRRSSRGSRERGLGQPAINYRLRDWLLSRQRYWGCPIPIIHCEACGIVPVPEDELPVLLPEVEDYLPKGRVAARRRRGVGERRRARRCGGPARRETDTMDTFVDSSWYFLRYTRPAQRRGAVRPRARRLLAAGRPVHRRDRARDPAPDVRALLHEGARTTSAWSASASRSRGSSTRG